MNGLPPTIICVNNNNHKTVAWKQNGVTRRCLFSLASPLQMPIYYSRHLFYLHDKPTFSPLVVYIWFYVAYTAFKAELLCMQAAVFSYIVCVINWGGYTARCSFVIPVYLTLVSAMNYICLSFIYMFMLLCTASSKHPYVLPAEPLCLISCKDD